MELFSSVVVGLLFPPAQDVDDPERSGVCGQGPKGRGRISLGKKVASPVWHPAR